MKVLIVRTSSLGDLVHMLPAISDMAKQVPNLKIDWVVESAFAEIPSWHPAINQVITVSHRKWRKAWWQPSVWAARRAVLQRIQDAHYDVVIDMQALLKSIGLVRAASGVKHGLDWKSAREPLCSLFYDIKHSVAFWQPAVTRQRLLASQVWGYDILGEPDFGLQHFVQQAQPHHTGAPYAVIMACASRADKLWPASNWQQVFDCLQQHGLALKLLSGSTAETAYSQGLILNRDQATVLPRMGLTEVAEVLSGASMMVGLDSGLTHLSAALGRDTIGIYQASTPVRTPLTGSGSTASLGDRDQPPSAQDVLMTVDSFLKQSLKPS
jgi:heptosyltransferase I